MNAPTQELNHWLDETYLPAASALLTRVMQMSRRLLFKGELTGSASECADIAEIYRKVTAAKECIERAHHRDQGSHPELTAVETSKAKRRPRSRRGKSPAKQS